MNGSEIPPALLIFSIGPVQDFIATARRTQDLWMGSYILAYLSSEAMKAVTGGKRELNKILYPSLEGQPLVEHTWDAVTKNGGRRSLTLATLPNKFTAQVGSVEEGVRLAKQAEAAVFRAWNEIASRVSARFPGSLTTASTYWNKTWDRQSDPHRWIEIYWVVYPKNGNEGGYGVLNRRAERAFEARKGLRDFLPDEELGEKCTVCGVRAALSLEQEQSRSLLRATWADIAHQLHRVQQDRGRGKVLAHTWPEGGDPQLKHYLGLSAALSAKGNERLCAICSTKRFAQRFFFEGLIGLRGGFPSASSVATVIFRKALLHENLAQARRMFTDGLLRAKIPQTLARGAFPGLEGTNGREDELNRYDGDLFFPETYTLAKLNDDYGMDLPDNHASEILLAELQSNLRDLQSAARRAGISAPARYYALLLMDGDKMGAELSKAKDVDEQRKLSNRLRDFAVNKVQEIVENQYLGRVVYAGGDDLLAFLPLEHVLDAAEALRAAFTEFVQLTASAGIAIAHHQAPLDEVLRAAREAEKEAKDVYDRNAVVFTVLKRSGERLQVGARWQYREVKVLEEIRRITQWMIKEPGGEGTADFLSSRFAYDAERDALAITGIPEETQPDGEEAKPNAHESYLLWLLRRHVEGTSVDVRDAAKKLAEIGKGLKGHLPESHPHTLEIARWLLLARFLASGGRGED